MQKSITVFMMIFAGLAIAANAQKLPNVQQGSVRTPGTIKIDGKATEWNNLFKAYNHATDIFYTLSNDDENLYLTVQVTDLAIVRKIINGGICLTIQASGKKSDKDGMRVVYPVTVSTATATMTKGMVISVESVKRYASSSSETLTDKEADSVMTARNKMFNQRSRWIGTSGFKDLDSLISVYNEDGIKAAGRYDAHGVFTCEIAIGLKILGFSTDNATKFSYHILLNGVSLFNTRRPDQTITVIGGGMPMGGGPESSLLNAKIMMDQGSGAATDFWGEYTLAKK